MREYTVCRRPASFSWEHIPPLYIDNLLWSDPVPIRCQARLCYDADALYIRMEATEPHIRAEETGPLGTPCLDSCLEFFFCPNPADERYFNIEYNPNGCLCFGYGYTGEFRTRLIVRESVLAPKVTRTEDGWQVEYRIPFRFVQQFVPEFVPVSGAAFRANCYKCGNLTVQSHYLSWNPVDLPKPCFHCPPHFGTMYFE